MCHEKYYKDNEDFFLQKRSKTGDVLKIVYGVHDRADFKILSGTFLRTQEGPWMDVLIRMIIYYFMVKKP